MRTERLQNAKGMVMRVERQLDGMDSESRYSKELTRVLLKLHAHVKKVERANKDMAVRAYRYECWRDGQADILCDYKAEDWERQLHYSTDMEQFKSEAEYLVHRLEEADAVRGGGISDAERAARMKAPWFVAHAQRYGRPAPAAPVGEANTSGDEGVSGVTWRVVTEGNGRRRALWRDSGAGADMFRELSEQKREAALQLFGSDSDSDSDC